MTKHSENDSACGGRLGASHMQAVCSLHALGSLMQHMAAGAVGRCTIYDASCL